MSHKSKVNNCIQLLQWPPAMRTCPQPQVKPQQFTGCTFWKYLCSFSSRWSVHELSDIKQVTSNRYKTFSFIYYYAFPMGITFLSCCGLDGVQCSLSHRMMCGVILVKASSRVHEYHWRVSYLYWQLWHKFQLQQGSNVCHQFMWRSAPCCWAVQEILHYMKEILTEESY